MEDADKHVCQISAISFLKPLALNKMNTNQFAQWNIMHSSATNSMEILESWRLIPLPSKIVWAAGNEAKETEAAFEGKRFFELDLGNGPFGSFGVTWSELTEEAGAYYFSSYLLLAMAYSLTLGYIGPGEEALLTLQSVLEGCKFGYSNTNMETILRVHFPRLSVTAKKAVALICECPPEYFNFVNFNTSQVRQSWGIA